jgi:pimeloyl-ACP methyl ester carboxylesterase
MSHLERMWEEPSEARFYRRLASFSRLILFDKRGIGLSDRIPSGEPPLLEERIDDIRAVMDAAASEHAALFGMSEGGPMAALFAATYPTGRAHSSSIPPRACRGLPDGGGQARGPDAGDRT